MQAWCPFLNDELTAKFAPIEPVSTPPVLDFLNEARPLIRASAFIHAHTRGPSDSCRPAGPVASHYRNGKGIGVPV
jgi:hypothetical protein